MKKNTNAVVGDNSFTMNHVIGTHNLIVKVFLNGNYLGSIQANVKKFIAKMLLISLIHFTNQPWTESSFILSKQ